ncbi:hypothetical protein VKT23_012746 [Stygiomarasmius scandens]|uniref:Uncharacterized protein n=1 Tax=Marasmiellus scandens TaxID=2682957 RepID=A0ABR1J9S2_9AGAR
MFDENAPNDSLAAHNISMPVIVGLEAAALITHGTSGIKFGPKSRMPENVTDSVDKEITERKEKSSIRANG